MDDLEPSRRQAVRQLQDLTNAADEDAAIAVLQSVDWDVHAAAELIFGHPAPAPAASPAVYPPPPPAPAPAPPPPSFAALVTRPLLALVAVPLHLLSGLVRLLFNVFRIPVPQLNLRFLRLASFWSRTPSLGTGINAVERWVRELEEETGAAAAHAQSPLGQSSSLDASSSLTARRRSNDDGRKSLPDFQLCSYEEMLRTCQRDARIGCVILVSAEHDAVAEFKRTTLTDPAFLAILAENEVVVWGGDVRDQDAWSAAEKLQATTYPFVAFLALQPRRTPSSSSSSSTSPPALTVLSRHQGPTATTASTLTAHLSQRLLPRVTPYLGRLAAAQRARTMERELREDQDRAFAAAQDRDRVRIEAKMREEREARAREAERVRSEEERRTQAEERMQWRRWTRRVVVVSSSPSGLRIAIRLPTGSRIVHAFRPDASLTTLYAVVDSLLIPSTYSPEDDPFSPPHSATHASAAISEAILDAHVLSSPSYWGFTLASAYPRVEIPWRLGARLADIEVLKGGGQVVVELVAGGGTTANASEDDDDDGYHTEESE